MSSSSGSGELLCPNWPFSNSSNVHACKNRGWFTEYTPFKSWASSSYVNDSRMPIVGIGTVILPVKRRPKRSGADSHAQLVLRNVLHCPSALCNIIGLPPDFLEEYNVRINFTEHSRGTIKDHDGRSVAYFACDKPLLQVQLSGPPVGPDVGPSALDANGVYLLNFLWSDRERARWEAFKKSGNSSVAAVQKSKGIAKDQPGQSSRSQEEIRKNNHDKIEGKSKSNNIEQQSSPPYTDEERQWLKKHYRNEYRFLRTYGLSIYKEEDRDEGRDIVRAIMLQEGDVMELERPPGQGLRFVDDDESDNDKHEDEDETDDDDEDDDEANEAERMADCAFDEESLRMVKSYYGSSLTFMLTYGLKFYDLNDRKEAQAIANRILRSGNPVRE